MAEATDATDEFPPLATRVASLPEAVQISLAMGVGENCLFNFARALIAFEFTTRCRLTRGDCEQAFTLWWNTAQPLLPIDADVDEYRFEFFDAVKHAKTPLGANPLKEAIARAASLPAPAQATRYSSAKLKRLVAVCFHLQKIQGTSPIFLSVRDAQSVIGDGNLRFASRMMDGLVHDGVLEMVERGKPGKRRASRYFFRMESAASSPPSNCSPTT